MVRARVLGEGVTCDGKSYGFGDFCLHVRSRVLTHREQRVALTDKAFEILLFFVERPGRALTRSEMMRELWADTVVEDGNLSVQISLLRRALGDSKTKRRYIETLPRHGYRFIAPVIAPTDQAVAPQTTDVGAATTPASPHRFASARAALLDAPFVGRNTEVRQLYQEFELALRGQRRVICVQGEPGIGKTSLLNAFRAQAERSEAGPVFVLDVHCLKQGAGAEPFLPFLAAIQTLAIRDGDVRFVELLRQLAPHWCEQIPALSGSGLTRAHVGTFDDERGRVLREFADALHALAAEQPVVVLLEDLHWADPSSIDLLRLLWQRCTDSRALIVGTFRPTEVALEQPMLRDFLRDLDARNELVTVSLPPLSEANINEYLERLLGTGAFPPSLTRLLAKATGGHPLFTARSVQLLLDQRRLKCSDGVWQLEGDVDALERGLLKDLQSVIAQRRALLNESEQNLLRCASIQGEVFVAAILEAVLDIDDVALEEDLGRIEEVHRLVLCDGEVELPGGQSSTRYRFAHALFQNAFYDDLGPRKRQQGHAKVAQAYALVFGDEVARIAGQLAHHHELGRRFAEGVEMWCVAAEKSHRLHAREEAHAQITRALTLGEHLRQPERDGWRAILLYRRAWTSYAAGDLECAQGDFQELLELSARFDHETAAMAALGAIERCQTRLGVLFADGFSIHRNPDLPASAWFLGAFALECEAFLGLWHVHRRRQDERAMANVRRRLDAISRRLAAEREHPADIPGSASDGGPQRAHPCVLLAHALRDLEGAQRLE